MRRILRNWLASTLGAAALAGLALAPATAAEKKDFKVAWSIYVGWMPWGYAADSGIVKKWADKYGITIEFKQMDYIESLNQYTAGGFDAVLSTNMDALSIPAAGGVDTTAIIVGDYSNGNDAILLKGKDKLTDIKGQSVNLVEFSVSHYLLARALESVKLAEKDVKIINTSDADIAAAYKTPDVTAVVTWKPMVSTIVAENKDAKSVFDSSSIPGEILDMLVAHTEIVKDNPKFAKALVGIWYEALHDLAAKKEAKEHMAKASGTDVPGFDEQLATTKLFSTPKEALAFTTSADLKAKNELVTKFLFDKALLGKDAKSAEAVGIEFPDKSVYGDKANVKLRYDTTFVKEAADGKL
jgi:NitT/TauT family transport system substrate-binding protein